MPWSNHDHLVSEGGLEPFADTYVLAELEDLWLEL
jgi:hypothetical protein